MHWTIALWSCLWISLFVIQQVCLSGCWSNCRSMTPSLLCTPEVGTVACGRRIFATPTTTCCCVRNVLQCSRYLCCRCHVFAFAVLPTCLLFYWPFSTWVCQFFLVSSSTCSWRESFANLVSVIDFIQARCPSCHPSSRVKALKETQSTEPNQWHSFILSLFTAWLLAEGALPTLCQLSTTSTLL